MLGNTKTCSFGKKPSSCSKYKNFYKIIFIKKLLLDLKVLINITLVKSYYNKTNKA